MATEVHGKFARKRSWDRRGMVILPVLIVGDSRYFLARYSVYFKNERFKGIEGIVYEKFIPC